MMPPSAKTYAKLGLFVILTLVGLVCAAFALGVRSVRDERFRYHTYFDESVQGLEIGAPVKYRGVSIGTVASIAIAPDRRHVDVTMALALDDVRRLGLGGDATAAVPPDLRAQMGSQGITGVKFVNIDFFDPQANPVPVLPFRPDDHTVPAAASLMKSLEDSLAKTLDRTPDLLEAAVASLARIDRFLDEVNGQRFPATIARVLADISGAVSDFRRVVRHVDQANLPAKTAKTIDDLDAAIGKVDLILERIGGDAGLVASSKRATDGVADLGRSVNESTRELDRTLRDIGDAARAVRDLADTIERDPDMLVKGRAPR